MHCEATSEKQAMGYLADGRATLVVGTHTHVPTADHRILPNGTAFMSDVGMTGDFESVIGMNKDEPLDRFLRRIPQGRFEPANGPATLCVPQLGWADLALTERAKRMARQGVAMPTLAGVRVVDPATGVPVPRDGATMGELELRGNTIMKGYLDNPKATAKAFEHGWFATGDLAVWHPDGYAEIRDRSKDIIISGGENISSLEVEECLYRHPKVMEAAVVARPDEKWGETPCAFVTLKPGAGDVGAEEIVAWCRERLAHFKAPKTVVFGPLPKTSTGKIQKFQLRERAKAL